jgi:hypothetical protein
VLSDFNLCDSFVPGAWRGVLEDLRAFLELEAALCAKKPQPAGEEELARLSLLHDRLVEASADLLEPLALEDLSDGQAARLLARALFLVTHINQCILGGDAVLDTAGSRTLPLYEADFYRTPENLERLRKQIELRLSIPRRELDQIEESVDRSLADAHRKQALTRALVERFALRPQEPDLHGRAWEFFQALYPDAPLVRGEVELILTSTLVFFCVPFAEDGLTTPRYQTLDAVGRQQIKDFLAALQRFSQQRFANFPAFGCLDAENLAPALLEDLARRSGLSPESVAKELPRMITVLPLAKIEEYVVHDVWGHGWQASMLGFEEMYEAMSQYADPLRLDETAAATGRDRITFRSCFTGSGAELVLDEDRFRRFVRAELAERLGVAMTAVLAELVADVAEFKLLADAPHEPDLLPSSSLFKLLPSKLDLTMQDVPFYFGQATKVFRLWAKSAQRRQRTVQELVQGGAMKEAAEAAVARAVAVWEELAAGQFSQELRWEEAEKDHLHVNVFTRLALNFLGIHRAMLQAYRHLETIAPGELPLKSFRDLLIMGASVFFEAEHPRNLWRVDEFLTLRFLPLCRRLGLGD